MKNIAKRQRMEKSAMLRSLPYDIIVFRILQEHVIIDQSKTASNSRTMCGYFNDDPGRRVYVLFRNVVKTRSFSMLPIDMLSVSLSVFCGGGPYASWREEFPRICTRSLLAVEQLNLYIPKTLQVISHNCINLRKLDMKLVSDLWGKGKTSLEDVIVGFINQLQMLEDLD